MTAPDALALLRARENARLLGVGFLMVLPSGKLISIPPEAVNIDPQKVKVNS